MDFNAAILRRDAKMIKRHGIDCTLPGATVVKGIVDMPQQLVKLTGRGVSIELQLEQMTGMFVDTDIAGLSESDEITIKSVNQKIDRILPDGTGITFIQFTDVPADRVGNWR